MDKATPKQLADVALTVAVIGAALALGSAITAINHSARISELEATENTTRVIVEEHTTVKYPDQPVEYGGDITPSSLAEALAMPCATEDSIDCYWLADTRTNGIGASFVNVEGHIFPLASLLGDAS